MDVQKRLAQSAVRLADETNADAILTLTEEGRTFELVSELTKESRVVAATPNDKVYDRLSDEEREVIKLSLRNPGRLSQIQYAVWKGLIEKTFFPGELIISLAGDVSSPGTTDTLMIYRISKEENVLGELAETDIVSNAVLRMVAELGWEGRMGESIGAAFIIGDSKKVLNLSNQLGVNPFEGKSINITDRENWDLIKDYAFLDGAFVVDRDGNVIAGGRFLNADVDVDIPKGLGARHIAVASMTGATHSRGITISESDGMMRIFGDGKILLKIDPKSLLVRKS